jgi:beta-galactosidase
MRRILGSILSGLCAVLCLGLAGHATAAPRVDRPFNDDWRMAVGDIAGAQAPDFDDAAWKPVTLPRAYNEDEAFKVDIHDLKGAIVWYRKTLVLPTDVGPAVGGKAFIAFEGVRQAGDVYVNGVRVGGHEKRRHGLRRRRHQGPQARAVRQPVVAVRVDSDWKYKERATGSGFQWNNDNFNVNYGGIHRAVRCT